MSDHKIGYCSPIPVSRPLATLPQTAQTPYFNVVGGKVKILDIIGEVGTASVAGANLLRLIANPTVGADQNLCADLDCDADIQGTIYTITGTLADAMIKTALAAGAVRSQVSPVIVAAGTIDLNTSANKAGTTKWTILYVPVDPGAFISVA